MTHSLMNADRHTHVKIVVVALVGAILVAGIGVSSRLTQEPTVTARITGPVIKAGQPVQLSGEVTPMVR